MKELSNQELIIEIDLILTENRDILSESMSSTFLECKERIKDLENLKTEKDLELRNEIINNLISVLFKLFLDS